MARRIWAAVLQWLSGLRTGIEDWLTEPTTKDSPMVRSAKYRYIVWRCPERLRDRVRRADVEMVYRILWASRGLGLPAIVRRQLKEASARVAGNPYTREFLAQTAPHRSQPLVSFESVPPERFRSHIMAELAAPAPGEGAKPVWYSDLYPEEAKCFDIFDGSEGMVEDVKALAEETSRRLIAATVLGELLLPELAEYLSIEPAAAPRAGAWLRLRAFLFGARKPHVSTPPWAAVVLYKLCSCVGKSGRCNFESDFSVVLVGLIRVKLSAILAEANFAAGLRAFYQPGPQSILVLDAAYAWVFGHWSLNETARYSSASIEENGALWLAAGSQLPEICSDIVFRS